MPVCPNCSYEYVEGITLCPDCGTSLVDEKYYETPEEWTGDNWEVVYTSHHEYEVNMIKDNLDGAGIISEVLSQKDHNFPAPGDFSVVKLLVRKEDVQSALNFIDRINKDKSEEEEEE